MLLDTGLAISMRRLQFSSADGYSCKTNSPLIN
jgi:hypothetical protein